MLVRELLSAIRGSQIWEGSCTVTAQHYLNSYAPYFVYRGASRSVYGVVLRDVLASR